MTEVIKNETQQFPRLFQMKDIRYLRCLPQAAVGRYQWAFVFH